MLESSPRFAQSGLNPHNVYTAYTECVQCVYCKLCEHSEEFTQWYIVQNAYIAYNLYSVYYVCYMYQYINVGNMICIIISPTGRLLIGYRFAFSFSFFSAAAVGATSTRSGFQRNSLQKVFAGSPSLWPSTSNSNID